MSMWHILLMCLLCVLHLVMPGSCPSYRVCLIPHFNLVFTLVVCPPPPLAPRLAQSCTAVKPDLCDMLLPAYLLACYCLPDLSDMLLPVYLCDMLLPAYLCDMLLPVYLCDMLLPAYLRGMVLPA